MRKMQNLMNQPDVLLSKKWDFFFRKISIFEKVPLSVSSNVYGSLFCFFPRVHRQEFPIRVSVLIFKNGLPMISFQEINIRSRYFSLGDF
jgi:hypothetical protein